MFVATTTPTELGWASGVVVAINMALLAELPWVGGDGRWLSTIPKPETEHDSAFGLRISTFFRPSAFELRASDLIVACLLASIIISLLWLRCSAPSRNPRPSAIRPSFGLRASDLIRAAPAPQAGFVRPSLRLDCSASPVQLTDLGAGRHGTRGSCPGRSGRSRCGRGSPPGSRTRCCANRRPETHGPSLTLHLADQSPQHTSPHTSPNTTETHSPPCHTTHSR